MAAPIAAAVTAIKAVGSYLAAASAASAAGTATLAQTAAVVAANAAISLAATAATSLLAPKVGQTGNPTDWVADPDAPIPFAFGRVGVAGNIVHRDTFGPDLMYQGFVTVLSGAGPINSFVAFSGDDQGVTFDGTGKAVTSQWANEMWMRTALGTQPASALVSPSGLKNGATLPGWGSSYGLSGKAAYMLVLGENSKRTAYPTGEPKPLWVIEGLKLWDPRLDSTYPGGSGACRLNEPSTWVYSTNPALCALKWTLGLWEGPTGQGAPGVDYQVGGIGAKIEGVDVAAFVEAANIADANGWIVAAYPTTDDDKAQVLDGFLQACGCVYASKAGKISCVQRAAPRASIVTISAADTAGPLEIDTAASRINRINTLRPRFWSEANRWQMTAIEEVTAEAYQTEDGGKRTRGVDFPFVPDAVQCGQLAALQIANTREGITGVIPLKPHLQRITPGDAFTITEPGFVLNGLKCLCLSTEYDPATGVHRVTFVSETDAKYPFALGQSPDAPESPTLTPGDGFPNGPDIGDLIDVVPIPPGTGGGQMPGFDLTLLVSNASAHRVLVEWALDDEGPWTQAYEGPPTTERITILVPAGGTYWIGITYFDRAGRASTRRVFGPFTAPDLSAVIDPALIAELDEQTDALLVRLGNEALDRAEAVERRRRQAVEVQTEGRANFAIVTEQVETVETEVLSQASRLEIVEAQLGEGAGSLGARVVTLEEATADLETGKADASRVTVLEAQVQQPGTGLLARATNLESRTATVESGLSAQSATISTVSAQAASASASATIAQAAAASADGKVNAVIGLEVNAGGKIAGIRAASNGAVSAIDMLADYFSLTADGGTGIEIDGVNGILRIIGTSRRIVLKPTGLVMWVGPTSVSPGAETIDNGVLGITDTDGFFGGATLTGPFDTGVQSGSISLTSSWQDIAVVASKRVRNGSYLFWPAFTHQGTGPTDGEGLGGYGAEYRIVSTTPAGGDIEVIDSNGFGQIVPGGSAGPSVFEVLQSSSFVTRPGARTGERRLALQARLVTGTSATLSHRRLRGFYAA